MRDVYSITTNQAAIAALFRVMNQHVGNLPCPGGAQRPHRPRADRDALGHAAATAHGWAAGHQHPQHLIAALARLAEAGEPA